VIVASPITVSETSGATVQVIDKLTVVGAADTATVTATPLVAVRDPAPNPLVAQPVAKAKPEHEGPAITETRGEIQAAKPSQAEVTQGPSILIDVGPIPGSTPGPAAAPIAAAPVAPAPVAEPAAAPIAAAPVAPAPVAEPAPAPVAVAPAPTPEPSPAASDPSTLVADLAAAHAAIAAATARAASTPSLGDAASQSKEMLVSEVRKDAVDFTHEEEAFFNAHETKGHTHATPKLESFDDLDEGYEPPKFWDRVFGRKKKR